MESRDVSLSDTELSQLESFATLNKIHELELDLEADELASQTASIIATESQSPTLESSATDESSFLSTQQNKNNQYSASVQQLETKDLSG